MVKKNFLNKLFSGISIIPLFLNSFLPYSLINRVYAQESTASVIQQSTDPTPIITPTLIAPDLSPTQMLSPTPFHSQDPTPIPSETPTLTITPQPNDIINPSPTATPSATPEPSPEASPSARPLNSPQSHIEFAGKNKGKMLLRKAGNLLKKTKKVANKDYVEGEVIVKFKKNKLDIKSLLGKARSFVFEKRFLLEKKYEMKASNIQVFKSKKSTEKLVNELKSNQDVEYVEPNYRRYLTTISSNDTYKDTLWGLDNTGQTVKGSAGTNDADIDAPEAWNISESSSNVIVAIVDSGVAYNHPDLQANMWDGSNCKDENGMALNDCNHGYDFEDNDKTPLPDSSSHGTHVAGIIAAEKNNAKGIIGVAPTTKIMALKFGLTVATEVKAIDFAIQNGAKIINASFGGGPYSQTEYDAINRFKTAGGIYVAAAGNNSSNNDDSHFYPSDYDLDNIISVAATDKNDEPATFSNYGATSVDVGAPGVDIYSTIVDIQTPVVLSESFDSLTPPEIPSNWEKTGNWGTFDTEDDFWGNVLYGDLNRPYNNSTDSTITSPTYNLSGASGYMGFFAVCDTQYATDGWHDYMALEMSGNGTDFTEIQRWDEASLDNDTDENNNTDGKTINHLSSRIPLNLLTDSFKFRFRWITDAEGTGTTGDGCNVDDIYIFKYVVDSSEKYEYYSGTSMAAPHVVGLAALIEGYNQNLSSTQVKNIILSTGDSLPLLVGNTVSGKRINAKNALQSAIFPKVITAFTVPGQTGETVIDEGAHTIGITVPFGTNVTDLVPTITISANTTVSPASGVANNFTSPKTYTVTAADSSTQAYTVTVTISADPIATVFNEISTNLAASPNNIANNLYDVTTANIGNFSGLYFKKFINEIPVGKLTFTGPLNLGSTETKTFLQNLGTKLDQGQGRIALNATESSIFAAAGATLVMYDMPAVGERNLIVRDDAGNILDPAGIVSGFTQATPSGDITFNTAHFTQFDIDTTKPVIAEHANVGPVEATSRSGAVVTYSDPLATDNIDPTVAAHCLSVSGSTFALGSTTVTCNKTDTAGNTAIPTTFTVIVVDTTKPVIASHDGITAEATSESGAVVPYTLPTATDNVDATTDANCTPNSGSTFSIGSTTVTCTKTDAAGNDATPTTFTVTVTANTPPSFDPIANQTVNEDAVPQNVSITNISPGPADESSQTVTLTATSSDTTIVPNPSISASGATRTLSFAPATNKYGSVTITVSANDGQTLFNTYSRTFTITINPVNDKPVAANGTSTTAQGATKTVTLIASDIDVPVQLFTYSIVANPIHVTLGAISGNQVTYTSNANYSGTDSFTYKVNDGIDDSNTATITITVIANPNAPIITSVATDNIINNAEKSAIHIIGTAEANSLVTVTITNGSNAKSGTQQLTGGATEYGIVLDGATASPSSLSDGTISVSATATNSIGGVSVTATKNVIQDTAAPTVTKLGNDSVDVTIAASTTAMLIFNESLSSSGKTAVINALTTGADQIITYSWNGGSDTLTITGHATNTTTFANDVVANVSDIAGNTAAGLLLVDSSLTETQTSPNQSGTATVNASTPQVVITNPTQAVDITISTGTTDPTINVSSFVNDGTGDIPQITINSDTADIAIPATKVTGPLDWNGVIAAPTVTTVTLPETSGETKIFSAGIEIGFTDGKLSFDEAVRILLPAQAGKRVGYWRPGTAFTEITNVCAVDNQATGNALGVDGECKIDSGLDLVIWTKHFTKFASYTQTANSTSSSSNSNSSSNSSSGGSASTPVCNDTKPGSAPTLTGVKTGTNSVTLTWRAATNPVSYYLITYGLTSGSQTWGNSNVGGADTTSYTVNGLSGNTRYYFKVRAGNGCKPGDYSNELSATSGDAGGITEPAAGFSTGVLGTTTSESGASAEISQTPKPKKKQIQGVEKGSNSWKWFTGFGFGGLLMILMIFYYFKSKTQKS